MWAHPGKQLLFMGSELGQTDEWNASYSLPWHLLESPEHAGVQALVRDLNRVYREHPALWSIDFDPAGFYWLEHNDSDANVIAFARQASEESETLVLVANFSPVVRNGYRVGLPTAGRWTEVLNTDSRFYGGSDVGNPGGVLAEAMPWNGQPYSAQLTIPPLAGVMLVPER
jgi:1,4-alpha-glucan branching enzyme